MVIHSIHKNEMCCCFTGHRDISAMAIDEIKANLHEKIQGLLPQLYLRIFIAGGALGFDMIAAETVLEFKQEFANIRLELALPYEYHYKSWSAPDRKRMERLIEFADVIYITSKAYHQDCYKMRNAFMVELSNHCIAFFCHDKSGTSQTINFAKKKGIRITSI